MLSIKNELTQLKEVLATAVAQIKETIATLLHANHNFTPYATTTNANQTMDSAPMAEQLTPMDIHSFITDLKHELATFFLETRTAIQKQSPAQQSNNQKHPKT